jgi:hypothetical protein
MSEKKVLRKTFKPTMEETRECRRDLNNDKHTNFKPNIYCLAAEIKDDDLVEAKGTYWRKKKCDLRFPPRCK